MYANETRSELFSKLERLGRELPEMRFGQLICNLAVVARGSEASAIWDSTDEELLTAVKWQLNQFSGTSHVQSSPASGIAGG